MDIGAQPATQTADVEKAGARGDVGDERGEGSTVRRSRSGRRIHRRASVPCGSGRTVAADVASRSDVRRPGESMPQNSELRTQNSELRTQNSELRTGDIPDLAF